jgi:DNA-binding Xre family transcriptional regulator
MPITWNLKKWLAVERDIYRPSELQAVLAERAGVHLTLQAISSLMNKKPGALRLQTVQALCNALDCKLSDFCDVTPDAERRQQRQIVGNLPSRLYGAKKNTEGKDDVSIFPDPHKYSIDDDN